MTAWMQTIERWIIERRPSLQIHWLCKTELGKLKRPVMAEARRTVAMEESKMNQDQDNASETSNSKTEVGERTFGSMDAPSAVGNEGAFSSLQ
jgi:hypothetical protein